MKNWKEIKAVTSIRVATNVLEKARQNGLNVSNVCETALRNANNGKNPKNKEKDAEIEQFMTKFNHFRLHNPLWFQKANTRFIPSYPSIFANPVIPPTEEVKLSFVKDCVQYMELIKQKKKEAKKKGGD